MMQMSLVFEGPSPTEEQRAVVDRFASGKSVLLNALAGTGKTKTAEFLMEAVPGHFLYIAFNKSIQKEASRRFQRFNCEVRTTHSLAYRYAAARFNVTKLHESFSPNSLLQLLSLQDINLEGNVTLEKNMVARLIHETYHSFLYSDSKQPCIHHVPSFGFKLRLLSEQTQLGLKKFLIDYAQSLWAMAVNPVSPIPLGHDGYLKYWSLNEGPGLEKYQHVFLDEAQDTNHAVVAALKCHDLHTAHVGDHFQQVYRWRGAYDSMEMMPCDTRLFLTHSFRFGEAIASYANQILDFLNCPVKLQGDPQIQDNIEVVHNEPSIIPDAVLCRTNLGAFSAYLSYLPIATPHILQGAKDIKPLLQDVSRLKHGLPPADSFFHGFHDWREVMEYTQSDACPYYFQSFINLVETHGEEALLDALMSMPPENQARPLLPGYELTEHLFRRIVIYKLYFNTI